MICDVGDYVFYFIIFLQNGFNVFYLLFKEGYVEVV